MDAVRHFLAQRHWAVLLCAATLLLKLLVPTGYMVDSAHGRLAIVLCQGTVAAASTPMAGMASGMAGTHAAMPDHGPSHDPMRDPMRDHGKPDMPCAFAGLSAAVTGAADPIQLAGLIAFVLAMGLVATAAPVPPRRVHLRPPGRGPPVHP